MLPGIKAESICPRDLPESVKAPEQFDGDVGSGYVVLMAIASLTTITAITIFSTTIAGINTNIIVNYAQAQSEVKVSIVSSASTLGDKAFSPNPVNTKVGDTVTWVNDDTVFHTVVSVNPSGVEKLERYLIQDYQDLLH